MINFKNFSVKDIILLIMLLICIFLYIGQMYTNGSNRKEIKRIEKENKELSKNRELLKKEIEKLKIESISYQESIDKYSIRIDSLSSLILLKDIQIETYVKKLNESKKEIDKVKKEIEKLKKNPIIRNNDELLDSIKEKLSK